MTMFGVTANQPWGQAGDAERDPDGRSSQRAKPPLAWTGAAAERGG